jgi:hypothetical protein
MLFEHGLLEIRTEVKNRTAMKSIVFADGDVISLADPELVTDAVTRTHVNSVKSRIRNAMLGADSLARCINYAAGTLGILVFIANFAGASSPGNQLLLALGCLGGSVAGQLGLAVLGRRLFSRII